MAAKVAYLQSRGRGVGSVDDADPRSSAPFSDPQLLRRIGRLRDRFKLGRDSGSFKVFW